METGPRQRREGRVDEVSTRARPPAHVRIVDDPGGRTAASHPAAPWPRVHPDDYRRVISG